jgi:RNA polymerase primary sigma factor
MAEKIPAHLIETINRLVRASRRLLLDLGREPTPEEIAERLAMPVEKVKKLLEIANRPIVLTPG